MPGLGDLSDMLATDALAATEIEIIKSRNIIGKAVDKLNLTINAQPDYLPIIGAAIARRHSGAEVSSGMGSYAWGGERIQLKRLVLSSYLIEDGVVLVTGKDQQYTLTDIDGETLLTGSVGEVASGNGVEVFISELVAREGVEFNLNKVAALRLLIIYKKKLKYLKKVKKPVF